MGVKAFFKASVPFLAVGAQMAGGPFGNLAASVLTQITGESVKPTAVADVMQRLTTTEAGMLQLKAAEQDYQLKLAALGFDSAEKMEEAHNADVDSARKREMALKDHTPMILAIAITVGFFSLLIFLCTHAPPTSNERILDIMLGSLGGAWLSVVGYYFGSSKSSDRKTELLAQAPSILPFPKAA